jgi:hypothetical protein
MYSFGRALGWWDPGLSSCAKAAVFVEGDQAEP